MGISCCCLFSFYTFFRLFGSFGAVQRRRGSRGLRILATNGTGATATAKRSAEALEEAADRGSSPERESKTPKTDMGLYDEELSSDILDVEVFEQIQACDEDDDRSFSRELIVKYFAQAQGTVPELNKYLYVSFLLRAATSPLTERVGSVQRDLDSLSKRGHFLKSSSAVIGIRKVRISCELVQTYAAGRVGDRKDVPPSETIPLLEPVLQRCARPRAKYPH